MNQVSRKKNKETKFSQCRTFDQCFKEGLISQSTLLFTQKLGFKELSPIQNAVIPLILKKHKDVLIDACTGSGKTLAFLIPIVEILLQKLNDVSFTQPYCCNVGALCLAPTRELATQIENVLSTYLSVVNHDCNIDKNYHRQKILSILFTGGGTYEKDCLFFSKKNKVWESFTILVATPGRLCSLVENLNLNTDWTFSNFNVLVFDEADRLLVQRASFETQLSSILKILPKQRLTLLVSATLSNEVVMFLKAGIRNPVLVRIESTASTTPLNSIVVSSDAQCEIVNNENEEGKINQPCHTTPDQLTNFYCILRRHSKVAFLLKFLISHVLPEKNNKNGAKCIVFFLTCYYAHYFYKLFSKLKEMYPVIFNTKLFCLNGKMSAKSRISETLRFRKVQENNSSAILFATDVAARGLDFPDVSWIVQFDPPTDPNMFVHRIGRTARAGKIGHSITLLCPSEETYIPFLVRRQVQLIDFKTKAQNMLINCLNVNLSNIFSLHDFNPDFSQALNEFDNNFTALEKVQSNENCLQLSMDDLKCSWRVSRTILLSDQDFIQKAAKAVVSFIRAYKENHLQYIFVFKDLEIGELAFSLALLRLPRVKEILGKHVHGFYQSSLAPRKIPYKDATKQEFYKQKIALTEEKRKEKKPLTQVVVKPVVKKRTRTDQRRAQRRRVLEEIEELQKDERLYKKLKKKKLSTEEYHRLLEEIIIQSKQALNFDQVNATFSA